MNPDIAQAFKLADELGLTGNKYGLHMLASLLQQKQTLLNLAAGKTGAEAITALLIGSNKTRVGKRMTAEAEAILLKRVIEIIASGEAIPFATNWAPRIHYADLDGQKARLAEYYALFTLSTLDQAVRMFYPPGVRFVIFFEDTTGHIIEGGAIGGQPVPQFAQYVTRYLAAMQQLTKLFGERVQLVAESSLLGGDWQRQCLLNKQAFASYLHDSEQASVVPTDENDPQQNYQLLDSYRSLQQLGWHGSIPQVMREYYRERIMRLDPSTSAQGMNEMMARMFAAILFHVQDRTFSRPEFFPGAQPLRHSFVAPVAGTLLALQAGKVYTKSLLGDTISAPSWAATGIILVDPNSVTRASLRPMNNACGVDEQLLTMEFSLKTDDGQVSVDAPVVLQLPK